MRRLRIPRGTSGIIGGIGVIYAGAVISPDPSPKAQIQTEEEECAVEALAALREAVRVYLDGAPLDEHGRFRDPARESLYRAMRG